MNAYFLLLTFLGVTQATFTGHRVFSLNVQTEPQVKALLELENVEHVMFWRDISFTRSTDVMVSGEYGQQFLDLLEKHDIQYKVMIHDVHKVLHEQHKRRLNSENYAMNWDNYHTLDKIYNWMSGLKTNAHVIVRHETIAKTAEGRELKVVVIRGTKNATRRNIWIDGGIHSNEWISPAVVTYIMKELVNPDNKNDTHVQVLLDNFEWHFLPIQNPDGYAFTHSKPMDPKTRMWRKNRAPNDDGWNCPGVDLNRNYGYRWNLPGGSSDWACSNNYRGSRAWSENEVYETAVYITAHKPIISINFHSYGQVWATPWAFQKDNTTRVEELLEGAKVAIGAIKDTTRTVFKAQTLYQMIGKPTAGSSVDLIYAAFNQSFVYGVELRDDGKHGMLLPPDQIIPSGNETWAAVKELANYVFSVTDPSSDSNN